MTIALMTAGMGASTALAAPANQAVATCVVPPQGIVVAIDTPNPNAEISPGSNVTVTGVAYDTASTTGSGIDRVSVFLGDRDAGGIFWGDATLGQPSPQLGAAQNAAGFTRRSPTIPLGAGQRDIFVYAHSSSGREASTSISVFLGPPPAGQATPAVPAPRPVCTPVPTPTSTPVAATPTATAVPPQPTATPRATVAPAANAPAPAAPAAAAPAPAAPAPAPAAAAPAPAPATAAQTTAPRGGGIPVELGLLLFTAGAGVVGGGLAWRRRERRGAVPRK